VQTPAYRKQRENAKADHRHGGGFGHEYLKGIGRDDGVAGGGRMDIVPEQKLVGIGANGATRKVHGAHEALMRHIREAELSGLRDYRIDERIRIENFQI